MTTPRVFFSYRRDDSLDATGRLHDRLQLLFPPDLFFRDIDDLKGGESFRARLDRELTAESCALVLAIIGPTWDSSDNMRRLKKTSDLVRRELIAAMERKIPVVPVLVDCNM